MRVKRMTQATCAGGFGTEISLEQLDYLRKGESDDYSDCPQSVEANWANLCLALGGRRE